MSLYFLIKSLCRQLLINFALLLTLRFVQIAIINQLNMKIAILTLFSILFFLLPNKNFAQPGDTTIVQAFTFGGPQDAIISFPDDGTSYEKILMYYTLKCVPGGAGGFNILAESGII